MARVRDVEHEEAADEEEIRGCREYARRQAPEHLLAREMSGDGIDKLLYLASLLAAHPEDVHLLRHSRRLSDAMSQAYLLDGQHLRAPPDQLAERAKATQEDDCSDQRDCRGHGLEDEGGAHEHQQCQPARHEPCQGQRHE